MNKMDKIIQDHKGKSLQLKKVKKKLKFKTHNSISLSTLKELLKFEKGSEVNALHYLNYSLGVDDSAYGEAEQRKKARIELLEDLIFRIKNKPLEKEKRRK